MEELTPYESYFYTTEGIITKNNADRLLGDWEYFPRKFVEELGEEVATLGFHIILFRLNSIPEIDGIQVSEEGKKDSYVVYLQRNLLNTCSDHSVINRHRFISSEMDLSTAVMYFDNIRTVIHNEMRILDYELIAILEDRGLPTDTDFIETLFTDEPQYIYGYNDDGYPSSWSHGDDEDDEDEEEF